MTLQSAILYLCVQFVDVIPHTQQKKLDFYIDFSAGQKSVESIVIFQHSKCAFDLNGSVDPIADPFLTHDVF